MRLDDEEDDEEYEHEQEMKEHVYMMYDDETNEDEWFDQGDTPEKVTNKTKISEYIKGEWGNA